MSNSTDLIVSFSDNSAIFAPIDVFTCGMGVFAYVRRMPFTPSQPLTENNSAIMEVINLENSSLGKGRRDYCFIATPDIVAQAKAQQRSRDGLSNEDGLLSMNLREARTLDDIEEMLGCSVLEHPTAVAALYYHDRIP